MRISNIQAAHLYVTRNHDLSKWRIDDVYKSVEVEEDIDVGM